MPLDFLLDRFAELSDTRALVERLPPSGTRLAVSGLPGSAPAVLVSALARQLPQRVFVCVRSEEHTSELQSLAYLVCRLLLEKKKKKTYLLHALRRLALLND